MLQRYEIYRKPLCIICFTNTEKSFQRVVSGDHKSRNIGKKLPSDIEEDKEEVRRS